MGVFGAVFGRKGDGGFSGPLLGACSGDGGFMLACISGCRGVIGCKVATGGVLRAKKFALLDHNTPNSAFLRLLGEFFRGNAAGGAALGELCRANWPCAGLGYSAARFRLAAVGGLRHAKLPNGVSELWMASFPPIGGGDLAVFGGVVAKLQTHSVKRVQIRLFRLNGSTIWRNRSLSWCVVRASLPEHAP